MNAKITIRVGGASYEVDAGTDRVEDLQGLAAELRKRLGPPPPPQDEQPIVTGD